MHVHGAEHRHIICSRATIPTLSHVFGNRAPGGPHSQRADLQRDSSELFLAGKNPHKKAERSTDVLLPSSAISRECLHLYFFMSCMASYLFASGLMVLAVGVYGDSCAVVVSLSAISTLWGMAVS